MYKDERNATQQRFDDAATEIWGKNGWFPWELEILRKLILEAEERGRKWAKGRPKGKAKIG